MDAAHVTICWEGTERMWCGFIPSLRAAAAAEGRETSEWASVSCG